MNDRLQLFNFAKCLVVRKFEGSYILFTVTNSKLGYTKTDSDWVTTRQNQSQQHTTSHNDLQRDTTSYNET